MKTEIVKLLFQRHKKLTSKTIQQTFVSCLVNQEVHTNDAIQASILGQRRFNQPASKERVKWPSSTKEPKCQDTLTACLPGSVHSEEIMNSTMRMSWEQVAITRGAISDKEISELGNVGMAGISGR